MSGGHHAGPFCFLECQRCKMPLSPSKPQQCFLHSCYPAYPGMPLSLLLPYSMVCLHANDNRKNPWEHHHRAAPDKPMPSCSYKLTQVPCLMLDCCHHLALMYILTSYPLHPCQPAGPQPSHVIPLPWQLPELSKPLLTEFLPACMPFPLLSSNLTHTLSPVSGDTEKALPTRC